MLIASSVLVNPSIQKVRIEFNPAPPGLLPHPQLPGEEGGGGGAYHAPHLFHEPKVVESRASRHSNGLYETHLKHSTNLTFEVKVRSKVKISLFYVLGPGRGVYRFQWPKVRESVLICMVKVQYEYKSHTK